MQIKSIGIDLGKTTFHPDRTGNPFPGGHTQEVLALTTFAVHG
jgi:hypothetical protein